MNVYELDENFFYLIQLFSKVHVAREEKGIFDVHIVAFEFHLPDEIFHFISASAALR